MPIKFSLSSNEPLSIAADVLVLGVPEGSTIKEGALGELAKALGPSMAKALKREDFTGKKDQTLELAAGGSDLKPAKVLLVGLGKPERAHRRRRPRLRRQGRALRARRQGHVARGRGPRPACRPPSAPPPRAWCSAPTASPSTSRATASPRPRSSAPRSRSRGKVDEGGARRRWRSASSVGEAICIARDLINEPPNELYPAALADRAVEVCQRARPRGAASWTRPRSRRRG